MKTVYSRNAFDIFMSFDKQSVIYISVTVLLHVYVCEYGIHACIGNS